MYLMYSAMFLHKFSYSHVYQCQYCMPITILSQEKLIIVVHAVVAWRQPSAELTLCSQFPAIAYSAVDVHIVYIGTCTCLASKVVYAYARDCCTLNTARNVVGGNQS